MPPPTEKVERIQNSDESQHTASSSDKVERDVEKGEDASPERTEFNEHARASRGGSLAALSQRSGRSQKYTDDGKRIMQEEDCWDKLGYSWPTWKKVRMIVDCPYLGAITDNLAVDAVDIDLLSTVRPASEP